MFISASATAAETAPAPAGRRERLQTQTATCKTDPRQAMIDLPLACRRLLCAHNRMNRCVCVCVCECMCAFYHSVPRTGYLTGQPVIYYLSCLHTSTEHVESSYVPDGSPRPPSLGCLRDPPSKISGRIAPTRQDAAAGDKAASGMRRNTVRFFSFGA